jgi:hypothetical protein
MPPSIMLSQGLAGSLEWLGFGNNRWMHINQFNTGSCMEIKHWASARLVWLFLQGTKLNDSAESERAKKIPAGSPNMSTNLNTKPAIEKIACLLKVTIKDDSDEDLTSNITQSWIGFRHLANTEELAKLYYHKLIEEEYYHEHSKPKNHMVNLVSMQILNFLAMVTAKITGTIASKCSAEMLLDMGSELNVMSLNLQEELGLPLDPWGSNWVLHGVSGHPVHLIGLCWNMPIDIGGLLFNHNFFVSRDSIENKDMIIRQPWLYNHALSID